MRLSVFIFILLVAIPSCNTVKNAWNNLNLFTIEDDRKIGHQVSEQINSDTSQFNVLPEQGNEELYTYIRGLMQQILNTGRVEYAEEFVWEVKIIHDPETLNAFATPGGYIYVYTGLMKFLDTEDELMGVMGHEAAHADLRHSTTQMSKIYGVDILRVIITGNASPGMLEQIALGLVSLKFSRNHESEADDRSVYYLCETVHNAAGAAGFFKKMEGKPSPPEFLSTHPNPGNRVEDIQAEAEERGCSTNTYQGANYGRIKQLIDQLPPPPKKETENQ